MFRQFSHVFPALARALPVAIVCAIAMPAAPALAQGKKPAPANQPKLVSTHGDWGVYVAQSGKTKTCYALGRPKKRLPAQLKRDDGFIFVSTRPSEGVRNEISIIMGFELKEDAAQDIRMGKTKFDMHAKGANLWVKNAAEEKNFLAVMRKSGELVVNAVSKRGNKNTDTYSLAGISQALERVQAACK